MKIRTDDFRVGEGDKVKLHKLPTITDPIYGSNEDYHDLLAKHVSELSALQQLLYASNRYSLLLIFQAMDAAGKDGVIKHVMSGVNPQGCQVFSFKHPSAAEAQHDFLWRTTRDLPERGRIGIFNRSYYEEVLILRVHPELLESEGLPAFRPMTVRSGMTVSGLSPTWSGISTPTAPTSSRSSSICPRKSNAFAFCNASTSRRRIGNSVWMMSRSAGSGKNTCKPMKNASARPAPGNRHGMLFLRTTKRMHV